MSSLTIRSESLLSVLMDGFFSGGATMWISWFDVEESNLVIAFPVVLDSMTNTDFSGIFVSNSDTPALDVLKTNDWMGDSPTPAPSANTLVVQLFLCASIPTLTFTHTPFLVVLFAACFASWIPDRQSPVRPW